MGWEGIQPCWDNKLRNQYKYHLEEPKGAMDFNLVYQCDNTVRALRLGPGFRVEAWSRVTHLSLGIA